MNKQRTAIYRRRKKILFAEPKDIILQTQELFEEDKQKEAFEAHLNETEKEQFISTLHVLWLQTIDHFWMEHLEIMEYMRSSVRLRAYGQRDPLIEYKNEAIRLFRDLEANIESHVVDLALRAVAAPKTTHVHRLQEIPCLCLSHSWMHQE